MEIVLGIAFFSIQHAAIFICGWLALVSLAIALVILRLAPKWLPLVLSLCALGHLIFTAGGFFLFCKAMEGLH